MTGNAARAFDPSTDSKQLVAAELAGDDVSLLDFARKAGRNIFSVIPEATRTQTYLRGPANMHYVCDPAMITELLAGVGRHFEVVLLFRTGLRLG